MIRWLLILLLMPGMLMAKQDEPKAKPKLRFRAKQHFQDLSTNITQLDGGVVINYGEMELSAGSVTLDKASGKVSASDNVILKIPSEQTEVKAHKIIYDYRKKTGEFINVYIKSGVARLRAKKAKKVGLKKYELYKGSFTTCDIPDDEACPWKIWSYKTKATLDGYATAAHPVFMISGFPVFYSPFTFFPIKRKRQSGFLMPDFGASDQSGFSVKNALFLTLGRSHDTTLSVEYLSKRGIKPGLEYRFMLDDLSQGQLNTYFLKDREFKRDYNKRSRFSVDYEHQLYFYPNFFNNADIGLISDGEYVKDFEEDIEGREDAGLEAKVSQGLHYENLSFTLEGIYYQNLLTNIPQDTNKNVTHKLPEFLAVWQPTNFFGGLLNFSAEGSYARFSNDDAAYEEKSSNGNYDEGIDLLLRAHRMDVFPKLSMPFRYKRFFEAIPSMGYRETQWWLPAGQPHKSRRIFDFTQVLKTNVSRVFTVQGKHIEKFKHVVEPTLTYRYSPFVKVDAVLPNFDEIDEIDSRNVLTWGLQNRFVFKVREGKDQFKYFDGIRLELTQNYDVEAARSNISPRRPFGPIKGIFNARIPDFSLSTEAEMPVYSRNFIDRISTSLQYDDPFSNSYKFRHTFSYTEDHNSLNGEIKLGFIDILKFYVMGNYNFDEDIFLEKVYKVTYIPKSKCWALNMIFRDRIDQGLFFNVSVNLLFGEQLFSLAKLRQFGEIKRLTFVPGKGDREDVYFE